MSYPLLENINKYVEEKGIAKSEVYISTSRLPGSIVEAAIEEMSKNGERLTIDNTCILSYDACGHLSLILTFNNMKTNLVVTDTNERLTYPNSNFKFTKIRSDVLFRKAQKNSYVLGKAKGAYKTISPEYLNPYFVSVKKSTNEEERSKASRVLNVKSSGLYAILKKEIEYLIDDGSIKPDYKEETTLDQDLASFEKSSIAYIDYINDYYLKQKQEEIEIKDVVMFEQDESEVTHRTLAPASSYPSEEKERKNIVLPNSFRDDVIKELHPSKSVMAKDKKSKDELDGYYACYLVQVDENEYKLIMEPYNGIKYTKVAFFRCESEINDDRFMSICEKYLSISEKEVVASENMVRLGHTTNDTYMNTLWYAVLRNEKIPCNGYTKNKVDNLVAEDIKFNNTLKKD